MTGPFVNPDVYGILTGIGAPVNAANIAFRTAWGKQEGANTRNNFLNTTQPGPGSTNMVGNSAGVQVFPTKAGGATFHMYHTSAIQNPFTTREARAPLGTAAFTQPTFLPLQPHL